MVEIYPYPLLRLLAFTTACTTTVQAVTTGAHQARMTEEKLNKITHV